MLYKEEIMFIMYDMPELANSQHLCLIQSEQLMDY